MTSRLAHPYERNAGFVPQNHMDSVALLDANWKLIYREKGKSVGLANVELYDRRADRADTKRVETKNEAAQHPQEVDKKTAEIGRWMAAQKQIRSVLGHGVNATIGSQTVNQLRALGYLGGKQ